MNGQNLNQRIRSPLYKPGAGYDFENQFDSHEVVFSDFDSSFGLWTKPNDLGLDG